VTAAPPDSPPGNRIDGVVVMLGSNIRPEANLPAAVRELASVGTVTGVSSVWQTAAIGDTTQTDFCNAAVHLATALEPLELVARLNAIETRLGRVRDPRNKNAARTIDLDLAVVSGQPCSADGKTFPDPEIAERLFLALPLEEIWPAFVLPDGRKIGEVAAALLERDAERLRLQKRDDIPLSVA